jgi:hypothetical protein
MTIEAVPVLVKVTALVCWLPTLTSPKLTVAGFACNPPSTVTEED